MQSWSENFLMNLNQIFNKHIIGYSRECMRRIFETICKLTPLFEKKTTENWFIL